MVRKGRSVRGASQNVGGWKLGCRLGIGGNGTVYRAERAGVVGAIKLLRSVEPKRVARFRDEVHAMMACGDIPGVLPILGSDTRPDVGPPWFIMGLAVTIDEELSATGQAAAIPSLRRVIEAILSIASTLMAMHGRGFSHRDVKPENLFFFNGKWAVGDFGLVSFEGKTSVTSKGERIGPLHYIAPEMLNSAAEADGRAADVFSLAKTLWVLATGQRFPLPGAYDLLHEACHRAAVRQCPPTRRTCSPDGFLYRSTLAFSARLAPTPTLLLLRRVRGKSPSRPGEILRTVLSFYALRWLV